VGYFGIGLPEVKAGLHLLRLYPDTGKISDFRENGLVNRAFIRESANTVSFAHPRPVKDIGLSVLKYTALTLYVGEDQFQ
jgi:hypothetical protein